MVWTCRNEKRRIGGRSVVKVAMRMVRRKNKLLTVKMIRRPPIPRCMCVSMGMDVGVCVLMR